MNRKKVVLALIIIVVVVISFPTISGVLMKKAIQENPDIILNVIRQNPQAVVDVVQHTQKANQQATIEDRMAKKRFAELKNPKEPEIIVGRPLKPGSNLNAPVTIVVYISFQCPKCVEGSDLLDALMARYPGKLKIHYKHITGDILSFKQAQLFEAVAALDQEKAWLLYDYMFENMLNIRSQGFDYILQYTQKLGFDSKLLSKDLYSQRVREALNSDWSEGKKFEVQGTPTFFINGISITGVRPMEEFTDLVDAVLISKQLAKLM